MQQFAKKFFQITDKGYPPLHNSRRQFRNGGLICLVLGIAPALFSIPQATAWWEIALALAVNPFLYMGLYFIGIAMAATADRPSAARREQKRTRKKNTIRKVDPS